MDVKKLFLSAALAATVGSTGAIAAGTHGARMEAIAPTVTQASCTAACEGDCGSAGGGLLDRLGLGSCGCGLGSGLGCDDACGLGGTIVPATRAVAVVTVRAVVMV